MCVGPPSSSCLNVYKYEVPGTGALAEDMAAASIRLSAMGTEAGTERIPPQQVAGAANA